MPSFDIQPTPNPNSLKITTDDGPFIPDGMESFSSKEEAAGHLLGERLFGIEGISNIFILPQFLTITKTAAVDWDAVIVPVKHTLRDYFEALP